MANTSVNRSGIDLSAIQQQLNQLQNQLQTYQLQQTESENIQPGALPPSTGFPTEDVGPLPPTESIGAPVASAYGLLQVPVEEAVQTDAITADAEMSTTELAELVSTEGLLSAVVLEDNEPIGVVTRDKIVQYIGQSDDLEDSSAKDLATEVDPLQQTAMVSEVLDQFEGRGVYSLPVYDDEDEFVGILSINDLVILLVNQLNEVMDTIKQLKGGGQ